jgi:hypothetical protein
MKDANIEISNGDKHRGTLSRAQQMRSEQEAETATLGRTFARVANGANTFSKLSRYETTIERGLYKALHELQRLQAARGAGNGSPPPVAVDVDVSGVSGESVYGKVFRNGFVSQKRRSEGRIGRNVPAVFEEPSVRTPPPWMGCYRKRLLFSISQAQLRVRS